MPSLTTMTAGEQILREMEEFANLSTAAQRYIRRSLEVRSGGVDTLACIARSEDETRSIRRQIQLYAEINTAIEAIPNDEEISSITRFSALVAPMLAFDINEGKLGSFAAFRFLYERLLGASARPWLPSIFMMMASLPELHPNQRLDLLGSVCADAVTSHWSTREPEFTPQWIEELAA